METITSREVRVTEVDWVMYRSNIRGFLKVGLELSIKRWERGHSTRKSTSGEEMNPAHLGRHPGGTSWQGEERAAETEDTFFPPRR